TPLSIGTQQDFSVCIGSKVVPESEQFFPQFAIVVNFSIEHNPVAVTICHGHVTIGAEIKNCESSGSQTNGLPLRGGGMDMRQIPALADRVIPAERPRFPVRCY